MVAGETIVFGDRVLVEEQKKPLLSQGLVREWCLCLAASLVGVNQRNSKNSLGVRVLRCPSRPRRPFPALRH